MSNCKSELGERHGNVEAALSLAADVVLAVALVVFVAHEDHDPVGGERRERVLQRQQRLALARRAVRRDALLAQADGRLGAGLLRTSSIASSESDIQKASGTVDGGRDDEYASVVDLVADDPAQRVRVDGVGGHDE